MRKLLSVQLKRTIERKALTLKVMTKKVQAENWWKSCNFPCMLQIGHFLVLLFSETSNVLCHKHYLQRFSEKPNKKKMKGKGKKGKVNQGLFSLFPVADTVTGGSLLNAGNVWCVSLSLTATQRCLSFPFEPLPTGSKHAWKCAG